MASELSLLEMGVVERLDDAVFLFGHGRFEGALIQALLAVAATARRKYPELRDREGVERVLRDARQWRLDIEYRGQALPIEHVLYKFVRCELVHAGDLPVDLEVLATLDPADLQARAGGRPDYVLRLSHGWFHHLLDVVKYDPVNRDLFDH